MGAGTNMDASIACGRIACGSATKVEIARVHVDLFGYCRVDTEGMIGVVENFRIYVDHYALKLTYCSMKNRMIPIVESP